MSQSEINKLAERTKQLGSIDSDSQEGNHNQPAAKQPTEKPQIPYRRDRTPSIVVQTLGLSNIVTESVELLGSDDEDRSQASNSSDTNEAKSSTSNIDETGTVNAISGTLAGGSSGGNSIRGSQSSLQNSSSPGGAASPVRGAPLARSPVAGGRSPTAGNNRRLSLTIGSPAPRRLSLTVEGLSSAFASPASKDISNAAAAYPSGNATGSLRNKVALKPGHSLMGWIKLASTAKDLSGTGGKIFEVTPEELAKHDKEEDCWVALMGNVYNITTYLQYHPGGVEELMRGAGRDATELFNEVHSWVNYESILAKCLIGPYKLEL